MYSFPTKNSQEELWFLPITPASLLKFQLLNVTIHPSGYTYLEIGKQRNSAISCATLSRRSIDFPTRQFFSGDVSIIESSWRDASLITGSSTYRFAHRFISYDELGRSSWKVWGGGEGDTTNSDARPWFYPFSIGWHRGVGKEQL